MLLPMMRDRLLTALSGTPDVLDGLLGPVTPKSPLWDVRPDPDRFTLREVLAHLSDYELIWQERIRRTCEEDRPDLLPADRDRLAVENDYAHSDSTLTRRLFRQRRTVLVDYLRGLPAEEWQKIGVWAGPTSGPLTLEEQAVFVVIHDGYHTQQAAQWTRETREES